MLNGDKPYSIKKFIKKIGYTCHFITNSTSTTLLIPWLKAHNKNRVEIFMYSDQPSEEIPDDVRAIAEHWIDTKALDNDSFCEKVRADNIDILLELNGHCEQNRYKALARKPAPIQVNYYNYSSTCGVPGIDYILVGENFDIDHLQPYYSEKIFHKKGDLLPTVISSHFPPVAPSPFIKNGYITFGSFGQAHKISREQIFLWCEVLKKVPNSRFYMKASALDCDIAKSVFNNHFLQGGVALSRIILEGASDYSTLLKSYSKVDIALDSYPFAGGTTTAEALIQGVPVISLMGDRYCSKHGWLNLHPAGHNELLSYSKEEFVNKAVYLANNLDKLIHYRNTLRNDYANSSRANINKFIVDLEDAYFSMWDQYLQKNSVESIQKEVFLN
jgi:protein O-GlcNAc transferase